MFNKSKAVKLLVLLVLLSLLLGCSQNMDQGQAEEIEYIVVSPSGNYTPAISSVPGLTISIETNENLATEDLIIKIRYSGGRLLKSMASFEWDRELYVLDLEYEDRTIYWSPFEEDGVFTEGDEIIVMDIFYQGEVIERKAFSITYDEGFYFFEEVDPYEKLLEQSQEMRQPQ